MQELTLTTTEARHLTDEVKADAKRLWAKLLSLYEGGAHTALGYTSWAAYCEQEFHMSQGRAYQLLRAARVVECTTVHSLQVTPESEAIARELAPLLNNPQALNHAWNEAVKAANGVPTAQAVREIVARQLPFIITEKKPLHDLEGVDPEDFKLATSVLGEMHDFSKLIHSADPIRVLAGLKNYERGKFLVDLLHSREWIDSVVALLREVRP
jgi:hypothetical protein